MTDSTTYFREILSGSIGGAVGVFVGHPLDLLKVHQQKENLTKKPSFSFLPDLLKKQGISSLFRGVVPPLIGGVAYQGLMFPSYELGLTLQGKGKALDEKENLFESILAGTFAGLMTTIGTTPLEVVKIKLQLDQGSSGGTKGATTKQLLKLFKSGGLYSGWGALAWRDGPGTGVYMGSYSFLKELGSDSPYPMFFEFLAGGFAGVFCWLSVLPFDTIKTRLQFDSGRKVPYYNYRGLFHGLKTTLENEGFFALFSGWRPVCARAFPVNAVTFFVYERTLIGFETIVEAVNI